MTLIELDKTTERWYSSSPDGLKQVLFYGITNQHVRDIIFEALDSEGVCGPAPAWPGHRFTTETDAGKALLGSPCGEAVSNLLGKFKTFLGRKVVCSIEVFDTVVSRSDVPTRTGSSPSMLSASHQINASKSTPRCAKGVLIRRMIHAKWPTCFATHLRKGELLRSELRLWNTTVCPQGSSVIGMSFCEHLEVTDTPYRVHSSDHNRKILNDDSMKRRYVKLSRKSQ